MDLAQRSGCLEEKNAKTQGRKDAKVVDLPQRSGCLDFSPEGDTSLPVCVSHRIARALGASVFRSLIPPNTRYRSQPCTSSFLAVGYGFNEIVFWRTLVPHEALAMLDVPFETDRCYGTSVRPPIAQQNAEVLGRLSHFDREF